jgi:three-Cys-motif partner protein
MSKKEYYWKIGDRPPELYVHSLAKHEVLRAYISRYLNVLTANPKIERLRLTLVDGFSGGGLYLHEITREEISGSPLIFLEATKAAAAEINIKKTKKFTLDAHYFFIEEKKQTLDYLQNLLLERGYGALLKENRIKLMKGTFSEKAAEIIQFIRPKGRKGRTIFLLDQYGYKDVPFPLLRQIFTNLPSAEVILTFAVDAFGDFLTDSAEAKLILSNMGLEGRLDLAKIKASKGTSDRRFFIQAALSPIVQKESGALFYTPFFITSRESNRDYWLVHLSMHARARDEMAKLHWEFKNHFRHNGGAGLNMLGYDPQKDKSVTGQPEWPDFNFDESARDRSIQSLRTDLPEFLTKHRDGIQFQQLLEKTCNTTPASSDLYRDVLGELLIDKTIIAISEDGHHRKKGDTIDKGDIIKHSSQTYFSFYKK